ncbi:peptidylprolyl isomerase [Sphingomonas sp. Root50]|nr:peptidylprolyl isomerase [Sphingomonas sp. Root1294]KQY67957.1 peptidylprolyl isomerase [Sphingomonas sp. Root50]KRB88875.1 peptidylprolyl isomerase [Sphingomonas sp. Root720]
MAAHADTVTLPDGTQIEDYEFGTGVEAHAGRTVSVHYTGWLWLPEEEARGRNFDSSRGGEPISFVLGSGTVIDGWDSGIAGMKEGGIRTLIIPPAAGYGAKGKGPVPPDSWMIFEVELIKVR